MDHTRGFRKRDGKQWALHSCRLMVVMAVFILSVAFPIKALAQKFSATISSSGFSPSQIAAAKSTTAIVIGNITTTTGNSECTIDPGTTTWSWTATLASHPSGAVNLPVITFPSGASGSTTTITAQTSGQTTPGTYTYNVQANIGFSSTNCGGTQGPFHPTTTISFTVLKRDYTLFAKSASLTIAQGLSGSSAINLTPINNFDGSVPLSCTIQDSGGGSVTSGIGVTFDGSVSDGAPTTMSVSVDLAMAAGTYTIIVQGNYHGIYGDLVHTTSVTLKVVSGPDFALSSDPTHLSVQKGGNSPAKIIVTSISSNATPFTGNVSLSVTSCYAAGTTTPATGISVSFSPATAAPNAPSTATIAATTGVAVGDYQITITGTSGTLSHTTVLLVSVVQGADFKITADAEELTIAQGGSAYSKIKVTSIDGFTGCVTIRVSGNPGTDLQCSPPGCISASVAGTTGTLTFTAAAAAKPGVYTITVEGQTAATDTPPNVSRSTTVTVAIAKITFSKVTSYTGFDDSIVAPDTNTPAMVIAVNNGTGSNQTSFSAAPLVGHTTITLAATGMTVSPSTVSGGGTLTVTANSYQNSVLDATLININSDGSSQNSGHSGLNIAAKTRQIIYLSFHSVGDSYTDSHGVHQSHQSSRSYAEIASMISTANAIWEPQANVHFEEYTGPGARIGVTATNELEDETSPVNGQGIDNVGNWTETGGGVFDVYFAWSLWGSNPGETLHSVAGLGPQPGHHCVISDTAGNAGNVLAHELGHNLGLSHNLSHTDNLMYPAGVKWIHFWEANYVH